MASQQSRRDNVTQEGQVPVQKDRVPKMATHYETLAGQGTGTDVPSGQAGQGQKGIHSATTASQQGQSYADRTGGAETATIAGGQADRGPKGIFSRTAAAKHADRARGADLVAEKEAETGGGKTSEVGKFQVHGKQEEEKGGTIGGRRESAQTGSQTEAKHSGEGQKSSGGARMETHQPQAQPTSHAQGQDQLSLEEISKLRQTAQRNSAEAIHGAQERYAKEKEKEKHSGGGAAGGGDGEMGRSTLGVVKHTALEKGQQGYVATKDTLSSAGQTAAQYTSQVAQKTKETVPPVVSKVKDVTLDTAKKVGSYAGQTAVAAKDVAVSTGATAAGYAGEVAVGVKDRAVVAGWGAAQMTAGVAAEATKAAANVTKGVVGYAGDTAVAAKDVVANVGQKAVQYTGDTVAQVKDTVVHAEESAKEYAARKRAEAERDLEAKKSPSKVTSDYGSQIGEGREGQIRGEGQAKQALQQAVEIQAEGGQQLLERGGVAVKAAGETLYEIAQTPVEAAAKASPQQQGMAGEGGVLQAVGETLVEIAQTATGLVSGGGGGEVVHEKRGQEHGGQ